MEKFRQKIEAYLRSNLPEGNPRYPELAESMRYSVLNGGKRIRPVLTLEAARLCGGDVDAVLPLACAVELVHCYSLIHDDLPCMDNDDMRRGLPTNHKAFGEACALLAGDALLTLAFGFILDPKTTAMIGCDRAALAALELTRGCGCDGMIGGQMIDLGSEGKKLEPAVLYELHEKKTGALIRTAVRLGAIAAGAIPEQLAALDTYSENLGLAFQIVDDILDVTGNTDELGKPVGSDERNGKSTFVTVFGPEEAKRKAEQVTGQAAAALEIFGPDAMDLLLFTKKLLDRKK